MITKKKKHFTISHCINTEQKIKSMYVMFMKKLDIAINTGGESLFIHKSDKTCK